MWKVLQVQAWSGGASEVRVRQGSNVPVSALSVPRQEEEQPQSSHYHAARNQNAMSTCLTYYQGFACKPAGIVVLCVRV